MPADDRITVLPLTGGDFAVMRNHGEPGARCLADFYHSDLFDAAEAAELFAAAIIRMSASPTTSSGTS